MKKLFELADKFQHKLAGEPFDPETDPRLEASRQYKKHNTIANYIIDLVEKSGSTKGIWAFAVKDDPGAVYIYDGLSGRYEVQRVALAGTLDVPENVFEKGPGHSTDLSPYTKYQDEPPPWGKRLEEPPPPSLEPFESDPERTEEE